MQSKTISSYPRGIANVQTLQDGKNVELICSLPVPQPSHTQPGALRSRTIIYCKSSQLWFICSL